MTIKFRVYASEKTEHGYKMRILVGNLHATEAEAQKEVDGLRAYCKNAGKNYHVGYFRFYTFSPAEWEKEQYAGVSLKDGKTKTWMTNEGNGCVLLFEGVHFRIV